MNDADRPTGSLIVAFVDREADTRIFHDTQLMGMWDGEHFIVPFHDEMTAEEVSRIVAQAIRSAP